MMLRRALTLLLGAGLSVMAPEAVTGQEPSPPAITPTVPGRSQATPYQPPFSPLFGPYTTPPTEASAGQPPRPPYMGRGGRAPTPEEQREQFVITPSILIDEAYTDNVFLDNDFKRSDFITGFTPGLLAGFRMPDFGISLGYVFTSEIYANETQLNDALARWAATAAAFYQFGPRLKFNVAGGYLEDNNTTASGIAGISTGRTRSRGGFATAGGTWQFDALTTIQLAGQWFAQSFDPDPFVATTVNNYQSYSILPTVTRRITPTLTGLFQYQYLHQITDGGDDGEYHLLLPGVNYQITPNLSGSLSLGPQIVTQGQTGTSLAVQLGLTQQFSWASVGLSYSRAEAPNGGLGGTSETNTVSLTAIATNVLLQGLTISVTPSFTNADGGVTLGTTNSVNIQLLATYPITRWMLAVLAYDFYHQRTNGTALNDVDVNRVTLGVQLFQPVRLR
ncbi:MAG: hypothetical protein ACREKS_20095 [Candidatus Rokuibacteriota bacterium]